MKRIFASWTDLEVKNIAGSTLKDLRRVHPHIYPFLKKTNQGASVSRIAFHILTSQITRQHSRSHSQDQTASFPPPAHLSSVLLSREGNENKQPPLEKKLLRRVYHGLDRPAPGTPSRDAC